MKYRLISRNFHDFGNLAPFVCLFYCQLKAKRFHCVNTCKTLEISGRDLILFEVVCRIEGVFKFNPKWKFFSCTAQRSRYFCVISQIILIE